jgi:hypothetical protein
MTYAMPRDPRDKTGRARLAAHERDSFDMQPSMSIAGGSFSGTGGSAPVDEYGQQMTPRDDYVSFLEQELNRLRGQASQVMPRQKAGVLGAPLSFTLPRLGLNLRTSLFAAVCFPVYLCLLIALLFEQFYTFTVHCLVVYTAWRFDALSDHDAGGAQ